MRPDQHKQKKSSQYKKKHGIQSSSKSDGQNQASEKKQHSTQNTPEAIDQEELLKSYAKRKVQTNWDKYEEDEQGSAKIGEDYNVLMSYASESGSHLKLKEEREWELGDDVDDILTIDCNSIAIALSQLSFCQRFGFDPSGFDPSLLRILGENPSIPSEDFQGEMVKDVFVDSTAFDFKLPNTKQTETHHRKMMIGQDNSTDKNPEPLNQTASLINNKPPSTTNHIEDKPGGEVSSVTNDLKCDLDDLECDLDDLLSNTEIPGKPKTNVSEKMEIGKVVENPAENTSSTTDVTTSAKETNEAEEDLEDWLDTIIS